MKVVFDSRWIYDRPSGIGVYAREMMCRLPRLIPEAQFIFLFCSAEARKRLMADVGDYANVDSVIVPYGPLSPKNQLRMPAELARIGADLFHSPNYMIPFLAFTDSAHRLAKCVVSIHDVIPLVVKDYAPNSRTSRFKGLFRLCLKLSVRRADRVITVSEASKRDLITSLALPPNQAQHIQVVYNGAGNRFTAREHEPIKVDETTPRTLLYVGRMDPYKNVTGLIEAFAQAKRRLPFPLKLIICGPADDRYPEPMALAAKLGVADDVRFTGFVGEEALAELYRTADLLTHASRYEGFGLQIVEAMRSGLPVCCTDGGSQPEIAGDAAFIAKAGDTLSLADAITEVLGSPETQHQMRTAGFERAKAFDWDVCAEQVAAIYRTI